MTLEETAVEVSKAAPPVGVSTLIIMGYDLSLWVMVLSGIFVVLQIAFLLRDKWWRDRNRDDPKE